MLTVQEIREKVVSFPNDKSGEELLNELWLLYKVKQGLKEADEGKGVSLDDFTKDLDAWWKSK